MPSLIALRRSTPLAYIPSFFQDSNRGWVANKGNSEDACKAQFLKPISTQSPYCSRGDTLAPGCLANSVTYFCRKAFDVVLRVESNTIASALGVEPSELVKAS